MATKRIFQLMVVLAILVTSFASSGGASAWGCASYITVQWGDTLSGIAATCGTTIEPSRLQTRAWAGGSTQDRCCASRRGTRLLLFTIQPTAAPMWYSREIPSGKFSEHWS